MREAGLGGSRPFPTASGRRSRSRRSPRGRGLVADDGIDGEAVLRLEALRGGRRRRTEPAVGFQDLALSTQEDLPLLHECAGRARLERFCHGAFAVRHDPFWAPGAAAGIRLSA
jgi:hypothetical protein